MTNILRYENIDLSQFSDDKILSKVRLFFRYGNETLFLANACAMVFIEWTAVEF